jgi:hypothetical protein
MIQIWAHLFCLQKRCRGLLLELLKRIIIEKFFAIRKELEQRNPDVIFTTDSDCEILLHLYKEHGPEFLSKVRSQNP